MLLDTIEIPKDEASRRLREYQGLLADERTAEDERIAAGYRAAARGLPVIRLSEAVHAGGYFDSGLPRIAVVRADASTCWFYSDWAARNHRALIFSRHPEALNRGALVGIDTVRVTVLGRDGFQTSSWRRAQTIVPVIPPRHRPRRHRLHRFHILWEVEAWEPVPPKDPALIKHVGGDLWAVHAVWDLTELERAVLAGRA